MKQVMKRAPDDLELMAYFDGEVDAERSAEIAQFLGLSEVGRKKIAGLSIAGAILREQASGSDASDAIADAVMLSLSRPTDAELMGHFDDELEGARRDEVAAFAGADVRAQQKLRGLAVAGSILRQQAEANAAADGIADAVMARIALDRLDEKRVSVAAPPPANDNSKRVLWLASLAVAAAAALFAWGRGDGSSANTASAPRDAASAEVAASASAGGSAPATVAQAPTPSASADPQEADDPVHGVEVAAVEFGTKMGSIFYVANGDAPSNATTTVVWLAEDVLGEE